MQPQPQPVPVPVSRYQALQSIQQNINAYNNKINQNAIYDFTKRKKSSIKFFIILFSLFLFILTKYIELRIQYKVLFDIQKQGDKTSAGLACANNANASPWNIILNITYPWLGKLLCSRPLNTASATFIWYCIRDSIVPSQDVLDSYNKGAGSSLSRPINRLDYFCGGVWLVWYETNQAKNTIGNTSTGWICSHIDQTPWGLMVPKNASILKDASTGGNADQLFKGGIYGLVYWLEKSTISASDLYQDLTNIPPPPGKCSTSSKVISAVGTGASFSMMGGMLKAGEGVSPIGAGVGLAAGLGLGLYNAFSNKNNNAC